MVDTHFSFVRFRTVGDFSVPDDLKLNDKNRFNLTAQSHGFALPAILCEQGDSSNLTVFSMIKSLPTNIQKIFYFGILLNTHTLLLKKYGIQIFILQKQIIVDLSLIKVFE